MEEFEFFDTDYDEKILAKQIIRIDQKFKDLEDARNIIFEKLEESGNFFENSGNLSIECKIVEEQEDGYLLDVTVLEETVVKVPYKIEKEEVFSGSFTLENGMTEEEQKRKVFELMMADGIQIVGTKYDIQYDEILDEDRETKINFVVSKGVNINSSKPEIIYKEISKGKIVPVYSFNEDIYLGKIKIEELQEVSSENERSNLMLEKARLDGIEIDNLTNLVIGISGYDDDFITYVISKTNEIEAIVEQARLQKDEIIETSVVGTGSIDFGESIEAAVQRNSGIDIRSSANYIIIFDETHTQKYTLHKVSIKKNNMTIPSSLLLNSLNSELSSNQLKEIDFDIEKLHQEIVELEHTLSSSFNKLIEREDKISQILDKDLLLSDDEIVSLYEKYYNEQREDYLNKILLERRIKEKNKKLKKLLKLKKKKEKELLTAKEMGLSLDEYLDIVNIVEDNGFFKKMLDQLEIGNILEKDSEERSRKDKKILRKVKKEIIEEIALRYKKDNLPILEIVEELFDLDVSNGNALENVSVLYDPSSEVTIVEEPKTYNTQLAEIERIEKNVANIPEKVVNVGATGEYEPLKAPDDMVEVYDNNVILYEDSINSNFYVNERILKLFNIEKSDDEISINDEILYRIEYDDAQFIMNNASSNSYSYTRVEIVEEDKTEEDAENIFEDDQDNLEKITIYVDRVTGEFYAKKYVFIRFNAVASNQVIINDKTCYKLDLEDFRFIADNFNNEYSPYVLDYQYVDIKREEDSLGDDKNEEVIMTFYRDLNDNNQIYVSTEILNLFELTPNNEEIEINDERCYKLSNDAVQLITNIAKKSENPKYIIKFENISINKKVRPHVETILNKLTENLDIGAKDYKRFTASNIKVSKEFVKELKSGNYLYNIVHIIPSLAKATFKFLRKLCAKLFLSKRGKKVMLELERRLNEELTEEEIEVLFDEYKGTQLKTDMNNQINGMILKKLRQHGLEKVEKLNDAIKDDYSNLFTLLGSIKTIDREKQYDDLTEKEFNALELEKKSLIDQAAERIKNILICRKDANNLLSGGVHGLEEDFKAVATKLSYVGMRFAKNNKFDNELQHELSEYGSGITRALENGDNEALLENFMGLESCYFDNTKIKTGLTGKRSVGSKYYSPLAEQFDYRDDPFIRDIFTTVALSSSMVSMVNSYRVHQIEANEVLAKQQSEVERVNNSYDYIDQASSEISNNKDIIQEGLKAQSHQDVLTSATTIERSALDMNNWSFNNAYHQADDLGHNFYNQFHQNVTNSINDITAKYGNGTIDQFEALQSITDIANNAQSSLIKVCNECSGIMKTYAENHPNFDLRGIQESLDYILEHPDALSKMNQAMTDTIKISNGLQGLSKNHIEALSSLPSDILSTVVCAASAAGLALNVSHSLNKKYLKKNDYRNDVVEMMEQYLNGFDYQDNENELAKKR